MKLFNIDLHISVIEDIKNILETQGHIINSVCLSDHTYVMNRPCGYNRIITKYNWRALNKDMCDAFYKEYKNELNIYDGFICAYPPSFAMLYEKFNKPIIIHAPIRMEVPFQSKPTELNIFIDFIQNGIDNKQIIPLCNSKYEKKYCERLTNREWFHIPSLCKYTGINKTNNSKFILYSQAHFECNHPNIKRKEDFLPFNYKWDVFNNISGVIHIPYNISTMSIFEQYTGNVPLYFPTVNLLIDLASRDLALQEVNWIKQSIPPKDMLMLADYYDSEWMPYIQFFDTFDKLKELINDINTDNISNQMRLFNIERESKIKLLWNQHIGKL